MNLWLGRSRHLSEARLHECYLSDRSGEGIDPPAADHLAACASCAGRYADLASLLDECRVAADDDTSRLFGSDQLRAQQSAIMNRLESIGPQSRVLSFPATRPDASSGVMPRRSRSVVAWVSAAAAAGLFVGASAELLYQQRSTGASTAIVATGVDDTSVPGLTAPPPPSSDDDVLLMSELEAARERPRTAELRAFEALTPRVQEIIYLAP